MLIPRLRLVPVLLAGLLGSLAACGTDTAPTADDEEVTRPTVQQVEQPQPRLAVTYDGGVLVVDATDGEVLSEHALEGFVRVNPAGDDRHAIVSRPGGFTALDLATWTADHGDHTHSWVDEPTLTDFTVPAEEPGHVVAHDGWTTLFDDGTGEVTAFATHDLAELDETTPELASMRTEDAHHGVAAHLSDGGWLHTVGTHDSRSRVQVVDADGRVLAGSDACPGVHGEAFAGEVAVLGCEDGVLLVDGGEVTKVPSPDPYGRIGNQGGSADSPYAFGDYKVDPDTELERPTRVSVVDTRRGTLRLVDLGDVSYSFRSLGRTPDGDGLVLGTDGALHLVDVRRARVADALELVDPWREPADWTEPRPTLSVVGGTAYVTDPRERRVHVVDLDRLRETASFDLPVVPNELVGVPG